MRLIKVAAAVLNQTALDFEGNRRRAASAIEQARDVGASIVCLPELCLSGYGCEDAFHAPATSRESLRSLRDLAPLTRGMIVSFGLPLMHRGLLYNVACLVCDGRPLGLVAKQNLAGDGLHYEPRWFRPWPRGQQELADDVGLPLGDLLFDCGGVRIGFEICEDAWVASRPGARLAAQGADIILNPSASHFAFGKSRIRRRFVLEGARAFQASYVYANLLGNESGRAIYDGDAMIASSGRLLAEGSRFGFEEAALTAAVIDVDATRMQRARIQSFAPRADNSGPSTVATEFVYPDIEPEPVSVQSETWEHGPYVKEEEFARAEALALFDYMRKSRSRGFVVSLSGGADSAACAVLVWLMERMARRELGDAGFANRLSYWPNVAESPDLASLLTCVYQSTQNSSDRTADAARRIAQAIGARWRKWDVDPIVSQYVALASEAVGRPLNWRDDDVALQNIQARARAPGVWMLANLANALLLATSNRSEAAVGYATMDGDTCGGLSPIAGIDKDFLRHWLRWMETVGPQGVGPLPALAAVNQQQPTAELRPASENQTDEGDLMPYDILDRIERAAIRDKQSPKEVFRVLCRERPECDEASLRNWIRKFFTLWRRNQWKRERYAPSFHLDDENLDPKTWCRFPILSGESPDFGEWE